jgi:hypothetical protein
LSILKGLTRIWSYLEGKEHWNSVNNNVQREHEELDRSVAWRHLGRFFSRAKWTISQIVINLTMLLDNRYKDTHCTLVAGLLTITQCQVIQRW